MIKLAKEYARFKHGDQKYGGHPYMYHLHQVYNCLLEFGYDYNDSLLAAAYLHDILEDTKTTYLELSYVFGKEVATYVWAVTGVGETREDRTKETILKLESYPKAIILKMSDRLCNMRFSKKNSRGKHMNTYKKELPKYEKLFQHVNKNMYEEMVKCSSI